MITALHLWAKHTPGTNLWHSLPDHSADVAATTEALLCLPVLSRRLAYLAGTRELDPVTLARLAALSFLHDIGKANRGFRGRANPSAERVGHIQPVRWLLFDSMAQPLRRRLYNALPMSDCDEWLGEGGAPLLDAVFAHHGRPWREDHKGWADVWTADRDCDPVGDLAVLGTAMRRWFAPAFDTGPELPSRPAFHHAFAGLLMLADWLGSDQQFFPWANGAEPDRMAFARARAREALAATGLIVEAPRGWVAAAPPHFARAFDIAKPLRPAQARVREPSAPCLVLEAETGSGKTEAALWRFLDLFARGEVDGLYFALPTRVAATQVYKRVVAMRDRVFPPDARPMVVLAVPGQQMVDDARGHPLPDFDFAWDDEPGEAERQRRWAAESPKRFLAAPIAVGTIDQALLATIRVKHAHMRGTALLRHLLVVDEVHASDAYMEGLLTELVSVHCGAGGHALLLSATLGGAMRARLLGVPAPSLAKAKAVDYPALSHAEAGRLRVLKLPRESTKKVSLKAMPLIDDPEAIAARALRAARSGGRVLVVRNTVKGAMEMARALEAMANDVVFRVNGVATLHHGRFAPEDRRRLDAEVETALHPEKRPAGGIVVVGTQTLEISLDIDADLLLTDLCPADVLLQRLGRLHRHPLDRPAGHERPTALVLVPRTRSLLALNPRDRHGLGGLVYPDLRIIEATWRLLEAHPAWSVPEMNRDLVERATHPEALDAIDRELRASHAGWGPVLNKIDGEKSARRLQGALAPLDRETPFCDLVFDTDERAATRLGVADRLIAFPEPLPGPFDGPGAGGRISAVKVPHWMLEKEEREEPATEFQSQGGAITFRIAKRAFRYDRFGLNFDQGMSSRVGVD